MFPDKPVQHADVIRQKLVPGLGHVLICRAATGEAVCDWQRNAPHRLWPRAVDGVSRISVLGHWQGGPVLLTESSTGTLVVALPAGAPPKEVALPRAQYQEAAGFLIEGVRADRVAQGRALFFRRAESAPAKAESDLELVLFDLSRGTLEPVNGGRAPACSDFVARWLSPEAFAAATQQPSVELSPIHSRTVFAVNEQTLATLLYEEHNGAW